MEEEEENFSWRQEKGKRKNIEIHMAAECTLFEGTMGTSNRAVNENKEG